MRLRPMRDGEVSSHQRLSLQIIYPNTGHVSSPVRVVANGTDFAILRRLSARRICHCWRPSARGRTMLSSRWMLREVCTSSYMRDSDNHKLTNDLCTSRFPLIVPRTSNEYNPIEDLKSAIEAIILGPSRNPYLCSVARHSSCCSPSLSIHSTNLWAHIRTRRTGRS
jgi:hypothetical protein